MIYPQSYDYHTNPPRSRNHNLGARIYEQLQLPVVMKLQFVTFPASFQQAMSIGKVDWLNSCLIHLTTAVKMVVKSGPIM